jgi:hypothetical protein
VGGDHDPVGGHAPARRLHDARLVGGDLDGPRALEAPAARGLELVGEGDEVLVRVELGLVLEPHGGLDRIRQRRRLDERRGKAGLDRGLRLLLGLPARSVGVGRPAAEVALDAVALDAVGDPGQRGLVGLAVGPCRVGAQRGTQLRVAEPVLRADLGRGVTGHAVPDAVGLEQHDLGALLLQEQGRGDPDDPAAEDDDIGVQVDVELGLLRLWRAGLEPVRALHRALRSASSSSRMSDSALRSLVNR